MKEQSKARFDLEFRLEAAQIIPLREIYNDHPQNGVALTSTFYSTLDRNLSSPLPNMRWHVSKLLGDRIPDNQPMLERVDRNLILVKMNSCIRIMMC